MDFRSFYFIIIEQVFSFLVIQATNSARFNGFCKSLKRSIFIALLALGGVPQAEATTLPAGSCGVSGSCLTFGDFQVYSLAFLNTVYGFGAPQPGEPFYVKSSPGELGTDPYIVIGTGTNNQGVVKNVAGFDNAYETPDGDSPGSFSTDSVTDPGSNGAPPTVDLANTWDADLSALRSFLGPDGNFVPYFNLNDSGSDGLPGIDLNIWVRMWLSDGARNESQEFTLFGKPEEFFGDQSLINSAVGPALNDATDPEWAYVHGTICVNNDTDTVLGFGPCTVAQKADGGADVDQNLGANAAAFAIYNATLNSLIYNSSFTTLHIDWRMRDENNGYEQAFLAKTAFSNNIPEPTSLALLGIGLAGFGASRKFRSL